MSRILLLVGVVLVAPVSAHGADLLLVVADASALTSEDNARITTFQGWGHTVTTIDDSDTQANFDTALASADVAYVAFGALQDQLSYKLRTTTVGVVHEGVEFYDRLVGWTGSSGGGARTQMSISIDDNTHPITTGLGSSLTLFTTSSNRWISAISGTISSGAQLLGTYAGDEYLASLETGATLANTYAGNSTASGRRLRLPYGGYDFGGFGSGQFAWSNVSTDGLQLISDAIDWAAGGGGGGGSPTLVGHWKLDETSGTVAIDSSGNGNDATYGNTPTPTPAVRLNGIELDAGDHLTVSSDSSLDFGDGDFSIALWCKTTLAGSGSTPSLVAKFGAAGYSLYFGADGALNFDVDDGPGESIVSTGGVADGRWRQVVAIKRATSLDLYIDGSLAASVSHTLTGSTDSGNGLIFGGWEAVRYFQGQLDDIVFYDGAMTEQQIAEHYGKVGHWKLNETSGTVAEDASPLEHDGTYGAGATPGSAGLRGAAAAFSNTSQPGVTVPASTALELQDAVSIAAWVYPESDIDTHHIVSAAGGTSGYRLSIDPDRRVKIQCPDLSGAALMYSTGLVPLQEWTQIVVVYDGSTMKIYLNGELDSSQAASGTLNTVSEAAGTVALGARLTDHSAPFHGLLDDIVLYNRAMTDQEIAEHYGFVGHWKLDETSGTVAADSSPLGVDGNHGSAPTPGVAGIRAGAASYPGGSGSITWIPYHAAHDATEAVSMAAWVRADQFNWNAAIFTRGTSSNTAYVMRVYQDGAVGWHTGYGNPDGATAPLSTFYSTQKLQLDRWHHIATTYDGTTVRIYIDNKLDSEHSLSGTLGVAAGVSAIGNDAAGYSEYFRGDVDDLVLYNRVMTDTERAAHFGKIGHWRLDETSGTVAVDSSGMGNDATHHGPPTLGADGVRGRGYTFGVDSAYLEVPVTDEIAALNSPGDSWAIGLWIKPNGDDFDDPIFFRGGNVVDNAPGMWMNAAGNLRWQARNTAGGVAGTFQSNAQLKKGRWTHVLIVKDGLTMSMYIDGVLDHTGTLPGESVPNAFPLQFARHRSRGEASPDADLDDIVLYNRAITPREIGAHYGLVGHWALDESSGTTATDQSLVGNDGTYTGSVALADGPDYAGSRPVAAFDGVDDEVEIPYSSAYDMASYTVSGWGQMHSEKSNQGLLGARFPGTHAYNLKFRGTITGFIQGSAPLDSYNGWAALRFDVNDTHAGINGTDGDLDVGEWAHVVTVVDNEASEVRVYLNGELKIVDALSGNAGFMPATNTVRIGNSWGSEYFHGRLADVRIHNRAINHAEVAELYGLVGWWRMEEASGTTVSDSSGVGNDGALVGSGTWTADAKEAFGALNLDGDSHVLIPDDIAGDGSNGLAVSAWARLQTPDTDGSKLLNLRGRLGLDVDVPTLTNGTVFSAFGGEWKNAGTPQQYAGSGWRHYVGSYDPTDFSIKFYVDGVLRATEFLSGPLDLESSIESRLGADLIGNRHFIGEIDDVRVYNRAIDRLEARALYYGQFVNGLRIVKWVEVANP